MFHALGNIASIEGDNPDVDEPYFENEALAELGFVSECVVSSVVGGSRMVLMFIGQWRDNRALHLWSWLSVYGSLA